MSGRRKASQDFEYKLVIDSHPDPVHTVRAASCGVEDGVYYLLDDDDDVVFAVPYHRLVTVKRLSA